MFNFYPSVLPRFLVAVLLVLFISACETLSQPPVDTTPPPPKEEPLEPRSCSASNNELELAEASLFEQALACLIINHPEQQRPEMHYNPILGKVARMRAEDMAEHGFYGGDDTIPPHVDRFGYGPNHYLCEAGYRPDLYCGDDPYANSVESAAVGGNSSHEKIFWSWLDSPPHRIHILGEQDFGSSYYYGIGYVRVYETSSDGRMTNSVDYGIFIVAFPPLSD